LPFLTVSGRHTASYFSGGGIRSSGKNSKINGNNSIIRSRLSGNQVNALQGFELVSNANPIGMETRRLGHITEVTIGQHFDEIQQENQDSKRSGAGNILTGIKPATSFKDSNWKVVDFETSSEDGLVDVARHENILNASRLEENNMHGKDAAASVRTDESRESSDGIANEVLPATIVSASGSRDIGKAG
jgi:hypothetical protein